VKDRLDSDFQNSSSSSDIPYAGDPVSESNFHFSGNQAVELHSKTERWQPSQSTKTNNREIYSATRLPPQSLEAEEAILGGILLDNEAINIAIEKLTLNDFYRPSNRAIFEGMCSLSERQEPIDALTLSSQLRMKGTLEASGGVESLWRLASAVPSAAHVGYYCNLVKNASLRRRMISEANAIIDGAFAEGDISEFIDISEQRILAISDSKAASGLVPVGDVVQGSLKIIESLYDRKDAITGTPSGYQDLDELTAGFQKSDLIIVAARPAMGKTALALSIGQFVAVNRHQAVAVFSLEMSKEQLVMRLLCSEARVDSGRVRNGHLSQPDFAKLVAAAGRISEAPLYIDDTAGLSVSELRAKARRLHREQPLSLIVVDYLQLMKSPAYSKNREQEISDISRNLKGLAKELNVPVIALSQLNRSLESRTDKRPLASDLRESGAIEQDADVIMFIYRDEVYNPETESKGIAEIIIAKQRSGPTGVIRLAFSGQYTRFDNYTVQFNDDLYHESQAGQGNEAVHIDFSDVDGVL
jgi:replicative DNA helicase